MDKAETNFASGGGTAMGVGVLPIPDLIEKNKELGQLLGEVHETLAWLFVLLILGHTAAALKHHFIDKDDILIRMSPDHRKHSREL